MAGFDLVPRVVVSCLYCGNNPGAVKLDVYLATPTVIRKSSKRIPFLLDDVDEG